MSIGKPQANSSLEVGGARVAIVAARFNADVVDGLVAGTRAALGEHGIGPAGIELVHVPGAWELPLAAAHLAALDRFDAIVALGAVIRGDTPHFEFVSKGCVDGLMQVQLEFGLPVGFGVLTCDSDAQARERAGDDTRNKGREAAQAVLAMISALRRLDV